MASPREFLAEAYSYARQAGLPDHLARLSAAQAALETGYGRSAPGNNYHGIKAGKSWRGGVQSQRTWEDVGGKRKNITAKFRTYASPVDSFRDWAKLVERKWPAAMTATNFTDAVRGLRTGLPGGYATDKKYKSKMAGIERLFGGVPSRPPLPITPQDVPLPTPRPDPVLFQGQPAPRGTIERRPLAPIQSMPPLTDTAFNARFGSSGPQPLNDVAFNARAGMPSAPQMAAYGPTPPPAPPDIQRQGAIDPRILAAYQQMAATRMAAPAAPVPAPQPPAPPLGPPQVVQPRPVYQQPMNFPSAPPAPPPSRPMDVYSGLADTAQDGMGNTVFNDQRGIGVTNRFGATTFSKDGLQTAAGGNPFGSLGIGGDMFQADPTLGGRSPAGNFARQGIGGIGGAAVGGLLGPIGSLLGGLVGRELAKPGGGKIGDFVNGVRTINGMEFARPDNSLRTFPTAPTGGPRDPRFSNRTDREMREISPKAAREISRGRGGLY